MTSSGSVVAFDHLSNTSAAATTTNGYLDSATDGMVVVNGGGGDGTAMDPLTCDNNNNEVTKHNGTSALSSTPPLSTSDESLEGQLLQHLSTLSSVSCSSVISKDRASGDQSIDSGVTGGDSDEADCGPTIHPPPRPSSSGGGSNCSIVEEGSGDDIDDLHERHRSPVATARPFETLDHDFFMNGLVDHEDDDDDQNKHVDAAAADDHDLGGSLEETSLQHGKGFEKDCNICQ